MLVDARVLDANGGVELAEVVIGLWWCLEAGVEFLVTFKCLESPLLCQFSSVANESIRRFQVNLHSLGNFQFGGRTFFGV